MTKRQIALLTALGLAVFCVLCFGCFTIISEQPIETRGGPTPTPKPTKPPHDTIGAKMACEEFMKRNLNFPLTAKFDRWNTKVSHEGDGKYFVAGFVTAENAFGVPIRMAYDCTVHYSAGNWVLDDLRTSE